MQDIEYYAPQTFTELLDTLGETGGRVLAGGTDIIPRMRRNMYPWSALIDASRIRELSFIQEINNEIQIGALTTHDDMTVSELLQQKAPLLLEAVWHISSPQLRARGTLGGNIANASPAGDTIPALYAYEARLRLVSSKGERMLRIEDFYTGPGATRLERGEMIHSILFSIPEGRHGSAFRNMGRRRGLAISVVNTAALLMMDDSGVISDARVALGSVAPTVVKVPVSKAPTPAQQTTISAMRHPKWRCPLRRPLMNRPCRYAFWKKFLNNFRCGLSVSSLVENNIGPHKKSTL